MLVHGRDPGAYAHFSLTGLWPSNPNFFVILNHSLVTNQVTLYYLEELQMFQFSNHFLIASPLIRDI
ncbi:unnamed protein product [Calypogeia fissa]